MQNSRLFTLLLSLCVMLWACKGDMDDSSGADEKKDAAAKVKKPTGPPPVEVPGEAGLRVPGGGKFKKTGYKGVDILIWTFKTPRKDLLAQVKSQFEADGWTATVDDAENKKDPSKSIKVSYKRPGKSGHYVVLGFKKETQESTVILFKAKKSSASSPSGRLITLSSKAGMRMPGGGIVERKKKGIIEITYPGTSKKDELTRVFKKLLSLFDKDGWVRKQVKGQGSLAYSLTKGSAKHVMLISKNGKSQMVISVL